MLLCDSASIGGPKRKQLQNCVDANRIINITFVVYLELNNVRISILIAIRKIIKDIRKPKLRRFHG